MWGLLGNLKTPDDEDDEPDEPKCDHDWENVGEPKIPENGEYLSGSNEPRLLIEDGEVRPVLTTNFPQDIECTECGEEGEHYRTYVMELDYESEWMDPKEYREVFY